MGIACRIRTSYEGKFKIPAKTDNELANVLGYNYTYNNTFSMSLARA